MQIYNYNSTLHKFKDLHDETGSKLTELEFKYFNCFCGCADYKIISTATRHKNHFDVVACTNCGTFRINPYMTEASVKKYYTEIYGPVKRKNVEAEGLYKKQAGSSEELFKVISKHFGKDTAILDYGSGAGGRLDAFFKNGYTNLNAFDYDEKYLAHAVSKGAKRHVDGNKYDLIILSHVIEHINEPVEFLKKLKEDYLKPTGQIYLEVPLYDNTVHLMGDFHLAHKFYFSYYSLVLLGNMAGMVETANDYNAIFVTPNEDKAIKDAANFPKEKALDLLAYKLKKARNLELRRKSRKFLKQLITK